MFHNLAVPVLHLFIWIVNFLSLSVDELNDDDDDYDDDAHLCESLSFNNWKNFVNTTRHAFSSAITAVRV